MTYQEAKDHVARLHGLDSHEQSREYKGDADLCFRIMEEAAELYASQVAEDQLKEIYSIKHTAEKLDELIKVTKQNRPPDYVEKAGMLYRVKDNGSNSKKYIRSKYGF